MTRIVIDDNGYNMKDGLARAMKSEAYYEDDHINEKGKQMTKLWNANIELNIEVVVAADTENEAQNELDVEDAIRDFDHQITVSWSEIKDAKSLPYGWDDSEPYGNYTGTCDKMMVEILAEQLRLDNLAIRDKNQLKLDLDI